MKIKNTTKVPTDFLRELVRFACPPSIHGFSIVFKNAARANRYKRNQFSGRCYYGRKHITCVLSEPRRFAQPYSGAGGTTGRGYLPWHAYTWEEATVALIAHELTHIWQDQGMKSRVWGAKGKQSERACDAVAIATMRRFRREWNGARVPITSPMAPDHLLTIKRFSSKDEAERLATLHGVQLSADDGIIWVNAPDSLCDADGEMEGDPYQDAHHHYSWPEALVAVKTYVALTQKTLDSTPSPVNLPT